MDKKLITKLNFFLIFLVYMMATAALSQEIIVSDNFSDQDSGWESFSDEDGSVAYEDGWLYIMDTTNKDKTTKSCLKQQFSDFVLDVDTKLIEGSDDNWHVIYCRMTDLDNNYGFGISADGYYAMDRWVDGERTWLIAPTESAYINKGVDNANHIQIKCVGEELSFFVNEHLLGTIPDSFHEAGDICLAARAMSGTFTKIAYDNFVLTAPD